MSTTPFKTNAEPTPRQKADAFLATADKFKLGHLPTEMRHPRTTRLSQLATDRLSEAIALLQDVEFEAMRSLHARMPQIEEMADEIRATLNQGGKVYLVGCGATGRLSLSLETLWREEVIARDGQGTDLASRVISFMAGGDYALVRSIENFEDFPEYGARQLKNLGFSERDLLIGTTEGGETPFVIGAIEEAERIAARRPYMIYCNPTDLLAKTVERSRRAIENPRIRAFSIETGPMAVSGSTRLQATTALMLAVGAALFANLERPARPRAFVDEFMTSLRSSDFSGLEPLIRAEADVYNQGGRCVHRTARYAMTVLTDTTERSPTFSLLPFENTLLEPQAKLAWTYVVHTEAKTALDAWEKILGRAPRPLDWPGFKEKYGQASLPGFDFSPASEARRSQAHGSVHAFDIEQGARDIVLRFDGLEARLPRPASRLCEHLILKVALNISSTLAMGRLGRFSGNLMLYVRAANNKLVDRAIRYIRILLEDEGITQFRYEDVCLALYETTAEIPSDAPAVWRTFERLRKGTKIAAQG